MKLEYSPSVEDVGMFARLGSPLCLAKAKVERPRPAGWRYSLAGVWVSVAFGLFMLAGGLELLAERRTLGLVPTGFAACTLILFIWNLLPSTRSRLAIKRAKQRRDFNATIVVGWNEAGIRYFESNIQHELEWDAIASLFESPTLLAIVMREVSTYIIPKRAFASDADREAFCAFVRSHLRPTPAC